MLGTLSTLTLVQQGFFPLRIQGPFPSAASFLCFHFFEGNSLLSPSFCFCILRLFLLQSLSNHIFHILKPPAKPTFPAPASSFLSPMRADTGSRPLCFPSPIFREESLYRVIRPSFPSSRKSFPVFLVWPVVFCRIHPASGSFLLFLPCHMDFVYMHQLVFIII